MNQLQIKTVRETLNLTQPQFAQLMGVHPITVSKWERGVSPPTAYQQAFFDQFERASHVKKVRDDLKTVLIAAGVIAALLLLLQAACKK